MLICGKPLCAFFSSARMGPTRSDHREKLAGATGSFLRTAARFERFASDIWHRNHDAANRRRRVGSCDFVHTNPLAAISDRSGCGADCAVGQKGSGPFALPSTDLELRTRALHMVGTLRLAGFEAQLKALAEAETEPVQLRLKRAGQWCGSSRF
jgi:hypothetical protein